MLKIVLSVSLLAIVFLSQPSFAEDRIVAVADVHGAFDSFVMILQKAGIIDSGRNWSGGKTGFVQTGDVPDRGPASRPAMDLLMKLEQQARSKGGHVDALLGNHEVMNIIGDLRYVSAGEYASFASTDSERKQKEAYKQYVEFKKKRSAAGAQTIAVEPAEEWMKSHPPGFVEHRAAYSSHGVYGKWLRGHDTVVKIQNILFVHGGLSPEVAVNDPSAINKKIREEIATFDRIQSLLIERGWALPFFTLEEMIGVARTESDRLKGTPQEKLSSGEKETLQKLETFLELGSWWSVHPQGPLWFRGYTQWTEEEGEAKAEQILKASGAKHIVVGHTPQPDGKIHSRFGEKIFLIDTGMLQPYYKNGRASALLYENGQFSGMFEGGIEPISPVSVEPPPVD